MIIQGQSIKKHIKDETCNAVWRTRLIYIYTILIERNRREQRVLKNKQKTKLHDLDKL